MKLVLYRQSGALVSPFNRTIWNWNKVGKIIEHLLLKLLIEPSGIEIYVSYEFSLNESSFNRTIWNWNYEVDDGNGNKIKLLIEPSGIEIRIWLCHRSSPRGLLIEPSGIEIQSQGMLKLMNGAFNRTIWNWNIVDHKFSEFHWSLLIEPSGIEIEQTLRVVNFDTLLLIEPSGIEIKSRLNSFAVII